ncbi:hypothetical protein L6452_07251 [Arctium lappa]|uniref:Uncharacterized protein n=1 Tax=Arctium lappa TaxID=4217 RepID=A0ACB9EKH5_ARCLA|nr:hypothetical protein L6452_07251 [Arctium lappa]
MEVHPALILLLISCFATASYAHNVHLSALNQSLIVSTLPAPDKVLKTGVDQVTITWSYNQTLPTASDSNYTTVEVKLCYAPVSQSGRDDRKTDDNLDNDKTCPFDITDGPYKRSNSSFIWTIPRDIPTATYFVRVYVINAKNHEIAYGQSTNAVKASSLFQIEGVADDQVQASAAWPTFGKSFGCWYVWLGISQLITLGDSKWFGNHDLGSYAFKRTRFLKWRIQFLERSIRKLDFLPGGIKTIFQDNYPEFVAKQVFINVPWWYLAFYTMMSPFMTQRTKSKVVFASPARTAEALFKYVIPEHVPIQYCGLSVDYCDCNSQFTIDDPTAVVTVKPTTKQTVEIIVNEDLDYPGRCSDPRRAASLSRFPQKRKERYFEKIRYNVRQEVARR